MKFTTLANSLSLVLIAPAAAVPPASPAPSDLPPAGWGGGQFPILPPSHSSWYTVHTTSSYGPTTTPVPTGAYKDISAENAGAGAVVAPSDTRAASQGHAVVKDGELIENSAAVLLIGQGGSDNANFGNGSIAVAAGAGSGAQNLTASANAASGVVILNVNATNLYMSANATANSTTTNTTEGPVTQAWAFSISEAYDDQGDYALAWTWVYSYISPTKNYTNGNAGGWIRGNASATGSYGYSGYGGYGGHGWNKRQGYPGQGYPPQAPSALYGRLSANATIGEVSAFVEANDPQEAFVVHSKDYSASWSASSAATKDGSTPITPGNPGGSGGKSGSSSTSSSSTTFKHGQGASGIGGGLGLPGGAVLAKGEHGGDVASASASAAGKAPKKRLELQAEGAGLGQPEEAAAAAAAGAQLDPVSV